MEGIHFRGTFKEFCVTTSQHNHTKCRNEWMKVSSYRESVQNKLEGNVSVNENYFIIIRERTQPSMSLQALQIAIFFSVNSDSWVDLVVYNLSNFDSIGSNFQHYQRQTVSQFFKQYDIMANRPFKNSDIARKHQRHVVMFQLKDRMKSRTVT